MAWTEARIKTMCKRWAEGWSAGQIARELGGVTRNAVIGKIHRLGLTRRVTPNRSPRSVPPRRTKPRITFVPNSVLKPVKRVLPAYDPIEPLCFEGGPRTILTVQHGECRYTDGAGPDAHLCGRATPVGAWCIQHARLVYQPTRKREQEDASIRRVTKWLDRKAQALGAIV